MTDITTWAQAAAEDGRRTGPEKAVAAHVLDFIRRGRMRIANLEDQERRRRLEITAAQDAIDACASERVGIEMLLADLTGPVAPAVAKPGRTRKPKVAGSDQVTNPGTAETLAIDQAGSADDALVIPAALDRRAAE